MTFLEILHILMFLICLGCGMLEAILIPYAINNPQSRDRVVAAAIFVVMLSFEILSILIILNIVYIVVTYKPPVG